MSLELTFPKQGCALVFGGSGGAGSAICEALARTGTPVAFTYFRGAARAEATLTRLKKFGIACSSHAVDGRDSDAVTAMVKQVADTYGGIHSAMYAAGPLVEFMPVSEVPPAKWREFLEADLGSFHNLIYAVTPYLRQSKGSFTAGVTFANRSVLFYDGLSAAPKAAVESVMRQMAVEEAQYGLRANSVGLGWIAVGNGSLEGADTSVTEEFGGAEAMETLRLRIPLKRPGSGEELANAFVFLASQQASYITGQALMVDGGISV